MTRIKSAFREPPHKLNKTFVAKLVHALQDEQATGQPFIYEIMHESGKIRLLVLWDEWSTLPLTQRTTIIYAAIESVEGKDYCEQIALASGHTMFEAVAGGIMPYQIIPALRKSDAVSLEQCHEVMLAEGASLLWGPDKPQLWFVTEEAAEACRQRLAHRLPGSEEIWLVTYDIKSQEPDLDDDL